MSLFEALAECIAEEETLRFEMSCDKKGQYAVLIQPIINNVNPKLSEEQMKIRAGLAQTLRLTGTPAGIDENLLENLASFANGRKALRQANADLENLQESVRQAQQIVHKKRQQEDKKTGKTMADESKPASDTDDSAKGASQTGVAKTDTPAGKNPTSLF